MITMQMMFNIINFFSSMATTTAKISMHQIIKHRSIVHDSLIYNHNNDINHLLNLGEKSFNIAVQCQ